MKYFLDTEFLEGKQSKKGKPTIDLISIGIVSEGKEITDETIFVGRARNSYTLKEAIEDNTTREYYAISKDFNIKAAWNRFQLNTKQYGIEVKEYWIRDNVLKPIFDELLLKLKGEEYKANQCSCSIHNINLSFNYRNLKRLIKKYGKTNKQIAEEVKHFIYYTGWEVDPPVHSYKIKQKGNIEFYGYYSAYDWNVFCWLYGLLIELPSGFPMYCNDLKQMLDNKVSNMEFKKQFSGKEEDFKMVKGFTNLKSFLELVKGQGLVDKTYPKQTNKHNALADAKWNKELYEFINNL